MNVTSDLQIESPHVTLDINRDWAETLEASILRTVSSTPMRMEPCLSSASRERILYPFPACSETPVESGLRAFAEMISGSDRMTVSYILWRSIIALASDQTITGIPVGAVVEAQAALVSTGAVDVICEGHRLRVLALDLLDSGTLIQKQNIL
jgi:hypothetical protein